MTYPVFIPSKGRANNHAKTFELLKIPFTVIVESQDEAAYREYLNSNPFASFLVLDKSDLGIAYARNFILRHCKEQSIKRFWMFDDNVKFIKNNITKKKCDPVEAIVFVEKLAVEFGFTLSGFGNESPFPIEKDFAINKGVYQTVFYNDCDFSFDESISGVEDLDICIQVLKNSQKILLVNNYLKAKNKNGQTPGGCSLNVYNDKQKVTNNIEQIKAKHFPLVKTFLNKRGEQRLRTSWKTFKEQDEFFISKVESKFVEHRLIQP